MKRQPVDLEIARRTRPPTRPPPWRRRILVAYITLYGSALGAATILVALVARAKLKPPDYEPEHLPPVTAFFMAWSGLIAGAIIAGALAHMLVRRSSRRQDPRIWLALALGFGILAPFFTGTLTPISLIGINLALAVMSTAEAVSSLVDTPFRAATAAFSYGTLSLGTTAIAAILLAVGSAVIDLAYSARSRAVATWAPPAIAVGLSLLAVGFSAFGPPAAIANLG